MNSDYENNLLIEYDAKSDGTVIKCRDINGRCSPLVDGVRSVVLIKVRFNPRNGSAHANQWWRNRFTMTGSYYTVELPPTSTSPTNLPSSLPTTSPSVSLSSLPTTSPSVSPSSLPTTSPSVSLSSLPSASPSVSSRPALQFAPSSNPSFSRERIYDGKLAGLQRWTFNKDNG